MPILAAGTEHTLLVGLAAVLVLGVSAQWLAWRMRLPAILLLLAAGIVVGPGWQMLVGSKLLDPDNLFGDLLYPIVSLSVAIILFEGGLTLKLADLRNAGRVMWRLVSIGALVTWIISAVAAATILGMPWPLAILLGAILVVTGPTVIGPLLRHVRPIGEVGAILKWEGIIIDPIGATLAILVFESIHLSDTGTGVLGVIALSLARTIGFGLLIGLASATVIVLLFRRFWIADQLQAPMTLMIVVAAFVGSNLLQQESGLLAVTVMGVALANQRFAPVGHILEFKESLTILLIGSLFVLLGSRLDAAQISSVGWRMGLFVLTLMVVARPVSVWVSTIGTSIKRESRVFLMCMAPRGIVAAAVSSVFALRLADTSLQQTDQFVPATFAVIVATVSVYGLSASWIARKLGLSNPASRGFVIAGANLVARAIASELKAAGQDVLLVDTNRDNIAAARMQGLDTFSGNILSEQLLRRIDGTSIGRLLALTPNPDVNALAVLHFGRHFGRSQVFQLPRDEESPRPNTKIKADVSHELRGRVLFNRALDYYTLVERLEADYTVKRTQLTREFGFDAFCAQYNGRVVPLFVVEPTGNVSIATLNNPVTLKAGATVIALVQTTPKTASAATSDQNAG